MALTLDEARRIIEDETLREQTRNELRAEAARLASEAMWRTFGLIMAGVIIAGLIVAWFVSTH